MARPANKKRSEVSIPGFGEGAFVRFTIDSLERLESEYGEDWLMTVIDGISKTHLAIIKTCIEVSLHNGTMKAGEEGGEVIDFSGMQNLEEVKSALYDALFLMLYGKTYEEKRLEEEEAQITEAKKKIKMLQDNPELLAAYSQQFEQQGIDPDSDPTKSEDLPS